MTRGNIAHSVCLFLLIIAIIFLLTFVLVCFIDLWEMGGNVSEFDFFYKLQFLFVYSINQIVLFSSYLYTPSPFDHTRYLQISIYACTHSLKFRIHYLDYTNWFLVIFLIQDNQSQLWLSAIYKWNQFFMEVVSICLSVDYFEFLLRSLICNAISLHDEEMLTFSYELVSQYVVMLEESSQPKYFFKIFLLQILRVLQLGVCLIFWNE